MPGRPQRKARLEREAAEREGGRPSDVPRRRKTIDPETMRRVRARALEVGSAQAAREFAMSASSVRSIVQRSKDEPPPPAVADPVAALRLNAQRVREASDEAFAECHAQVRRGLGSESRNLAVTGAALREQARQLDDDARAELAHRKAISEQQASAITRAVEAFVAALGVPIAGGSPARRVWASLLRQVGESADASTVRLRVPEAEVEQVRCELREQGRRDAQAEVEELRRQLDHERRKRSTPPPIEAAEPEAGLEPPAAAEPIPNDPAAGVTWETLPADWKARYGGTRGLGVWEWANALRRESQQSYSSSRRSAWDVMRSWEHPGLRGSG